MKVRTRYAPSPTGFMHIGNLRTAIFEYLLAKKYDGAFILRIEDTDQERQVPGAIDFIYKTLELCNMNIDEGPMNDKGYGPYIQSERKDIYKKYAEELVEKGAAYYCFCTEDELSEMRKKCEARHRSPWGKTRSRCPYNYRRHAPRYRWFLRVSEYGLRVPSLLSILLLHLLT